MSNNVKSSFFKKEASAPKKVMSMRRNLVTSSPSSKRDLKHSTSALVAFTLASNVVSSTSLQPKRRPCSASACSKTRPPINTS